MIKPVVVDTGPLVAIISANDEHHDRCVATLKDVASPLLTCWPVVTEAAWLLRNERGGVESLFRVLRSSAIRVVELDGTAVTWIGDFLSRYASLRTQVADAAVMFVSEQIGASAVFTLDRRDFSVFRTDDGQPLRLIPDI